MSYFMNGRETPPLVKGENSGVTPTLSVKPEVFLVPLLYRDQEPALEASESKPDCMVLKSPL